MLSAARRPSSLPFPSLLRLSLPSSLSPHQQPFSTSPSPSEAQRVRLSKAKRVEKDRQLARKREIRDLRREREERRGEGRRAIDQHRVEEVRVKKDVGAEIADSLPPFSELQLEAMYRGLALASPAELSNPLLAAPSSALALPDPEREGEERKGRLSLLERRLGELERELAEEVEGEGGAARRVGEGETDGLAERLRRSRAGEGEVEEGEEVEVAQVDSSAQVEAYSPARVLLERIAELLPAEEVKKGEEKVEERGLAVPRGLLTRSEWTDLVLECAEEGDREGVEKGLRLMERTTPISEGKVLEDALAIYASSGRTQDALALASFARQNSLPLSVTAHHHLLTTLLPSHPELAIRHLKSMEAAGHTPLLQTYTAVIHRLLVPSSPPHLRREGWNLYSHTRAVAYPVPDVFLFSTMILACSSGAHPAPERAIDLFTEMTHDNRLPPSEAAFNGVIRACAREGSQEYYYEALRFMRRMLDDNVMPTRHTFNALLEGAKKHGDLARARWMLVKMVSAGGDASPTEKTLALLLQTYAAYKPESRNRLAAKKVKDAGVVTEKKKAATGGRPANNITDVQDPTALPPSTPSFAPSSTSPSYPASTPSSTQAVIEMLGEASLFYPGPLPTTSAETALEARNLMLQVVEASVLSPPAPSSTTTPDASSSPSSPPTESSMFPSVTPNTFLLNSYLSVLNSHAPFASSVSLFSHAYALLSLPKNSHTYAVMMRRCELVRDTKEGVRVAEKVFEEWLGWRDEKFSEEVGEEGGERKERERWERDRRDGKNASRMWGGMIRTLARAQQESEALAVLKRFVSLYPPADLAQGIVLPTLPSPPSSLPAPARSPLPQLPIRLASPLYPETSPSLDALRPPFLLFPDLKLLHHRLVEMEDTKGVGYVTGVGKSYQAALRTARRVEESRA